MNKKKKWFMVAAAVFLIWLCRPLSEEEKRMGHLFWLGFEPSIEETTELPVDRMGEFLQKVEERIPFQFELAESQTTTFLINEQKYVISPETGLLLLPDGSIAHLNHGMYALGIFVHEDALYFARGEERKHLWLPGLFIEGDFIVTRYKMEYRCFQPETNTMTALAEKEYLALLEKIRA